jgi:hypothetical protein
LDFRRFFKKEESGYDLESNYGFNVPPNFDNKIDAVKNQIKEIAEYENRD